MIKHYGQSRTIAHRHQKIIIPREQFEEINVSNYEPFNNDLEFQVVEAVKLRWNDLPGFGYSKSLAKKYLVNRYRSTIKPIRLTLKKAIKDKKFNDFLSELKNEAYLDWQILLIIFNAILNYRTDKKTFKSVQDRINFQKEIMNREELESDIEIPMDTLLEYLLIQKELIFGSVAKTWQLVIKQPTPDIGAIKKLLDAKYANSTDDIPHEDFFSVN